MHVTLTPAYGRNYKTKAAVIADWKGGKDFVISCVFHPSDGRYINREQAQHETDTFSIRYSNNTKITKVN